MEWPKVALDSEQTHELAVFLYNEAEHLVGLVRLAPDVHAVDETQAELVTLREKLLRRRVFELRRVFIGLHGFAMSDVTEFTDEIEGMVNERASILYHGCPACRTWQADLFERLDINWLRKRMGSE